MSNLIAGKSVVDGYLFMGNFSQAGQIESLYQYKGREWREPVASTPGQVQAAVKMRYKSGWVPVVEHLRYLEQYVKIHPSFVKECIDELVEVNANGDPVVQEES